MNNTEIMTMLLFLKLRNFYRRNRSVFLLLFLVAGVLVAAILIRQWRDNNAGTNIEPEWTDWHPAN